MMCQKLIEPFAQMQALVHDTVNVFENNNLLIITLKRFDNFNSKLINYLLWELQEMFCKIYHEVKQHFQ